MSLTFIDLFSGNSKEEKKVSQTKYEISDDQVDKIAKAIYKDVAKYIRDHRDEEQSVGENRECERSNNVLPILPQIP